MNLVYGSSFFLHGLYGVFSVVSDSYFDGWGSYNPVLLHLHVRRWTSHLWKLLLRFTHLQDEY